MAPRRRDIDPRPALYVAAAALALVAVHFARNWEPANFSALFSGAE
jgi:hypothetical protein